MTTTTGLAAGVFLRLSAPQLKLLRSKKGDPSRRKHLDAPDSSAGRLDVGDAWWFLAFIGGREIGHGKPMLRGAMQRIDLLDIEAVSAALAGLAASNLRAAFFAMDEKRFRYENVAFWVANQWKRDGRTTALDDQVFRGVASALPKLASFVSAARESDGALLFTVRY